jgi:acetylornithine deacetylase/succinyl-diaminopimelate desuccinylase-like protein
MPLAVRLSALALALGGAFGAPCATAQHSQPAAEVERLLASPAFKTAAATIDKEHGRIVEDGIKLAEIPSPPFKEAARAKAVEKMFRDVGLADVKIDEEGNVLGLRKGAKGDGKFVVVSAHMDTVFPAGTDVKVKREGTRLHAPGIGDDTMSLSVLAGFIRAMNAAHIKTGDDILFVGTVGEEGPGDLRGVRYLFTKGQYKDRIKSFFSVESADVGTVTNAGVGSKRYHVAFNGPGGHSFGAFGMANPMGAMGRAIAKIQELQVPKQPRTTFNVGRIGGGTSVNSIPFEGWMELDMRSSDPASLAAVDANIMKAIDASVAEENARWGKPGVITVVKELVGDRPAGSTPENSSIVRNGLAAATVLGFTSNLGEGSTDSNTPMALGVPAITIGGGGRGRDAHALTENFDVTDAWMGTQHALLLTVALAQK